MSPGRWLFLAIIALAIWFGFEGGEYSTLQWLELRRDVKAETARVKELQRRVDSLTRVARMVENDPETQERIAREKHGMLKRGEHAFILEDPQEREP
jgi:cell division protein FtsB